MSSKIYVVGTNSDQLSSYLRDKGNFNIVGNSLSLSADKQNLESGAIISDKLVIVLNDVNMNFRREYIALRDLTLGENIFRYTELFVFARNDDPMIGAYEEMLQVLADDVRDRITLPVIDINYIQDREDYSLEVIYNTIIGQTEISDFNNSYTHRIRRPKGEDAKFAYEPGDSYNMVIKPYSYKGVIEKTEIRNNAIISDDKRRIMEEASKVNPEYPEFPYIETGRKRGKDVMLIVGQENSGKTLLGTSLSIAASVQETGNTTLIVDFKKESDYHRIFEGGLENRIPAIEITMKDIFKYRGTSDIGYRHSILKVDNILHLSFVLDKIRELPFANVILEFTTKDLNRYWEQIKEYIGLTIFMCNQVEIDVIRLRDNIKLVGNSLVSLTDYLPVTSYDNRIEPKRVKSLLGQDTRVMMPINLRTLDIPIELYTLVKNEVR